VVGRSGAPWVGRGQGRLQGQILPPPSDATILGKGAKPLVSGPGFERVVKGYITR